jgi:hypothetical protein
MNSLLDRALLIAISGIAWLLLPTSAIAEEPQFRPALVGNGPHSLVNLIHTQRLLQTGQGDAAVMFSQWVFPMSTRGDFGSVYRATSDSKLLQKEILHALSRARFIPALAHGKPVPILFQGTVLFFAKTEPHLRVFANQDPTALARYEDFIAPQMIIGTTGWNSRDERLQPAVRLNKNGAVTFQLHVNAKGKLLSTEVVSEEPRGYNFAAVEKDVLSTAEFIPGFRNGKPCDCTFQTTRYIQIEHYFGYGWR